MSDLVRFEGVSKEFTDARSKKVTRALDRLDLGIAESQFVCVVGPSGCGKSTLLSAAAGIEPPTTGKVWFDGQVVTGPHHSRGMVFQDGAVFPWLTALENVCYGPTVRGVGKKEATARGRDVLEAVGLSGFENHYPRQLSGGMRQRVAIARSLANEPRLLLMDEPFGALDAQTRLTLQDLLLRVRESYRGTVLFVTHDVDEAILLGDRVVVLSARPGRVVLDLIVDLPRPRTSEVEMEETFLTIKRRVREALRGGVEVNA